MEELCGFAENTPAGGGEEQALDSTGAPGRLLSLLIGLLRVSVKLRAKMLRTQYGPG